LKNEAKTSLLNNTLKAIRLVRAHPSITPADLAELNLPVHSRTPKPVPLPLAAPTTTPVALSPTQVKVTVRLPDDPDRRARPVGVRQIGVVTAIGESAPSGVDVWSQPTLHSTTEFVVDRPDMPFGGKLWVACWYINSRNATGPMSRPLSLRLVGTTAGTQRSAEAGDNPMKLAA
jgi:hypothetical protein